MRNDGKDEGREYILDDYGDLICVPESIFNKLREEGRLPNPKNRPFRELERNGIVPIREEYELRVLYASGEYERLEFPNGDVIYKGLFGFASYFGHKLTEPLYKYAFPCDTIGLSVVGQALGKYGLVDLFGNILIPMEYEYIEFFFPDYDDNDPELDRRYLEEEDCYYHRYDPHVRFLEEYIGEERFDSRNRRGLRNYCILAYKDGLCYLYNDKYTILYTFEASATTGDFYIGGQNGWVQISRDPQMSVPSDNGVLDSYYRGAYRHFEGDEFDKEVVPGKIISLMYGTSIDVEDVNQYKYSTLNFIVKSEEDKSTVFNKDGKALFEFEEFHFKTEYWANDVRLKKYSIGIKDDSIYFLNDKMNIEYKMELKPSMNFCVYDSRLGIGKVVSIDDDSFAAKFVKGTKKYYISSYADHIGYPGLEMYDDEYMDNVFLEK